MVVRIAIVRVPYRLAIAYARAISISSRAAVVIVVHKAEGWMLMLLMVGVIEATA